MASLLETFTQKLKYLVQKNEFELEPQLESTPPTPEQESTPPTPEQESTPPTPQLESTPPTPQLESTPPISPEQELRRQIASRYLSGSGIEIGALHSPLEIPTNATVRYVDRMTVADLRKHYRELAEYELVEVDIIDDGETLPSIADASVDFVIANHMIEHCQNPIGTIEQHLRVLKPGGILYMAVPDKRYTFDRDRPVTSLEHLIRDAEGSEWSMQSHFEEWNRLVNKVPEEQVAASTQHLIDINYSIHFHVWTQVEFLELLFYCRNKLLFAFEIELLQKNGMEFITVLRKT